MSGDVNDPQSQPVLELIGIDDAGALPEGAVVVDAALAGDLDETTPVAVLDTDQDGDVDVVAADLDEDGTIDTAVADTDGDGRADLAAADTNADGQVDAVAVDTNDDGTLDTVAADLNADGIIDAVAEDTNADGVLDTVTLDTDFDGEADGEIPLSGTTGAATAEANEASTLEDPMAAPVFDPAIDPTGLEATAYGASLGAAAGLDPSSAAEGGTAEEAEDAVDEEALAAEADAAAQAEAARQAQAEATAAVEEGDYERAASLRETAEDAAWEAGDNSMLTGSTSAELEAADWHHDQAEGYQRLQEEHVAEGDFAAARDDASNAGFEQGWADYKAGGADRTTEADADYNSLDWAVWRENSAESNLQSAEYYAEAGEPEVAAMYVDSAAQDTEASLDFAGDAAAASVDVDTTYDASYDTAVDTSYEAPAADTSYDYSE